MLKIQKLETRTAAGDRDEGAARGAADAPRYRLFVYDGPDSVVTAYAIDGCPVEEALEAAEMLSRHDALLWSLALVTGTSEHELTWISGTDYLREPSIASEWEQRGQMQSRLLSATVRAGALPRLPNGLRVIRMFPEWGVGLPLWGHAPEEYPYEPGALPLPEGLERELVDWGLEWGRYDEDATRPAS